MAKDCDNTFLIHHHGTEQSQRYLDALAPENFNLNDFSLEDWMKFAFTFAKEINYFGTNNDLVTAGNWESFFIEKEKVASFLKGLDSSNDLTPHLTLFICFLKLLDTSKTRFNGITKRHLDFYYQKILQINKKEAVADKVHLIFELAKNTSEAQIKENTFVEAGKDVAGNKLQYATDFEAIATKANITSLKSVYHHRVKTQNLAQQHHGLYAATAVNSADGKGEPFKDDANWYPFGYPAHYRPEMQLETPKLGFAVAAPTLFLKEGNRSIQASIILKQSIGTFNVSKIIEVVDIYATGAEGWLGPYKASGIGKNGFLTVISGKSIRFHIEIDKTEKAITAYNKAVHGENFETSQPVLRFLIKTKQPEFSVGYDLYSELLQKQIKSAAVEVVVFGATLLQLKNDFGGVAADKPFFPFGTQPVVRSAFYVDYPELFQKKWDSLTLEATWLNTPDDFKDHYIAYRKDNLNTNLSPLLYYQTVYHTYDVVANKYSAPSGDNPIKNPTSSTSNLYVTGNDYFKAKVLVENNETYQEVDPNFVLFKKDGAIFKTTLDITNSNFTTAKNGPVKLSLNQSFLHALFPKVYALALTNTEDTILPNEPYTPIIETIEISYKASQEIEFGKSSTSNLAAIQLFHEHPFGQAENTKTLVPTYCSGGELYIALENTEALQKISILFQLLEGTENPLAESFSPSEKIEWAVLSNNEWLPLDSTYLLGNTTDNFLKTGIVTIALPSEATTTNTLLAPGSVWLRAKSTKSFDAVCRFINIHAQVITASFRDNNNDLTHLETGLEAGLISKLTERDALVKGVSQPYNSFGGAPTESDSNYYQRISERIRHRDRAIAQWDYEHLILENFKDIHKVKCLNHTNGSNYHAAGYVSVVVIPDIINKNAFDIFQPRVSTARRNEIQTYINNLNSFFIEAKVINPDYEEIQVSLNVKFAEGFDANFYTRQLEQDIKKYLAPWAYKESSELNFGISFHRSKLISYIEQKNYVDFLDNVVVKHRMSESMPYTEKVNVLPSSPKAILVSAKTHFITAIQSVCGPLTINKPVVCLP